MTTINNLNMIVVGKIIENMKQKIKIQEIQIKKQYKVSIKDPVVPQLYKPIIKQCTIQTQTTRNDIVPITYIQEPDHILLVEKLVVLQNSNNTSTSRCTIL